MNIYLGMDSDAHLGSYEDETTTLEAPSPGLGTSKKIIYQGIFLLFY